MADAKTLIDRLNTALSWELAGIIQYMQHSVLVTGELREVYAEFFEDMSKEARSHAQLVGDRIVALGGIPSVEPARIRQALELPEMLKAALELERDAMAAYEKAWEIGDVVNLGTKFWLEEQISEEQEHIDHLVKLTGGVKPAATKAGRKASKAG